MKKTLTIASLFSGGGLVEVGAIAAGLKPIWGIEFDPEKSKLSANIADCYEQNIGAHVIRKPVQVVDWTQLEPPDVLWASPVCTRMSAANSKSGESEKDLELARVIALALEVLKPSAFCLENVPAYKKSKSLQIVRDTLYRLGYGVTEQVLNAADFGVPQSRKRFILRAVLGQFPPSLPFKALVHAGWYEAIADLVPTLPESQLAPWQLERLRDLEESALVRSQNSQQRWSQGYKLALEPAMTITRLERPKAFIVEGRNINKWGKQLRSPEQPSFTISDASRGVPRAVLLEGQGPTHCETSAIRHQEEPALSSMASATSQAKALLIERSGARSDRGPLVRTDSQPSWTIRAAIGTDQNGNNRNQAINAVVDGRVVSLTARALARLQTLPDWYQLPQEMKIAGPLLGNGVPCKLAQAILESIRSTFSLHPKDQA